MTKMKTYAAILASTLAIGATGAATSAAAQPWHHSYADSRLTTSYVDGLQWKINHAAQIGRISWRQARELRAELRTVQPLAYRVETGAARPWEVRRLEQVVNRIDNLTQGYAYNMRRPYYRR
jgi:hypothetical protein